MPIHKLTDVKIKRARKPSKLCDGGGLYIKTTETGSQSGVFRFKFHRVEHWMGLGPYHVVGLAGLRERARECRKLLSAGISPLAYHKRAKLEAAAATARTITFAQAAELYIQTHDVEMRSPKHRRQWLSSLARYVFPVFGAVPVDMVDDAMVLRALEPIWLTKSETAARVRQRIEAVLDWARARKFRATPDNPARWRGHLDHLLAKRNKTATIKHQPALPWAELPEFMVRLKQEQGVDAQALAFLIFTNPRAGDIVGQWDSKAKAFAVAPLLWRHVDRKTKVWVIPMTKTDGEHRIPLSNSGSRNPRPARAGVPAASRRQRVPRAGARRHVEAVDPPGAWQGWALDPRDGARIPRHVPHLV